MAIILSGVIMDGVVMYSGGSQEVGPGPGGGTAYPAPSTAPYSYQQPRLGGGDQYIGSTTVDPSDTLVSLGYSVGDAFVLYGVTVIDSITTETTLNDVINAVFDQSIQDALNQHFGTLNDTFSLFVNADKKLVIQRVRNGKTDADGNPVGTDENGDTVPDTTQREELPPPGNDDAFGKTGLIYQTDVISGNAVISTKRYSKTDLLVNVLATSLRPAYFYNSTDFTNTDIPNDGLPAPKPERNIPAIGTPGMETIQDLIDWMNSHPLVTDYQPAGTGTFTNPMTGATESYNYPETPGSVVQMGMELMEDGRLRSVSPTNYFPQFEPLVNYQGINQYAPFQVYSAYDLFFGYHLDNMAGNPNYNSNYVTYKWRDENDQDFPNGVDYPALSVGTTLIYNETITRKTSKTVNNT